MPPIAFGHTIAQSGVAKSQFRTLIEAITPNHQTGNSSVAASNSILVRRESVSYCIQEYRVCGTGTQSAWQHRSISLTVVVLLLDVVVAAAIVNNAGQ
jgi:hypothetical protein